MCGTPTRRKEAPVSIFPGLGRERVSLYSAREEWLRERARASGGTAIGASEVAIALGCSEHRSPWDLWTARRGGQPLEEQDDLAPEEDPDEPESIDWDDPRERGQLWEPWVRNLASVYLGRPVLKPGEPFGRPDDIALIRSAEAPWMQASVDGWVVEPGGRIVPCELKTDASRGCHQRWGKSGTTVTAAEDVEANIRLPYAIQLASQIGCTGATHGYIVVLLSSFKTRWFRYEPDPRLFPQLLRLVGEWRQKHLIDGEEPDPDGSKACLEYMREKYAGRSEGIRPATPDESEWMATIAEAKRMEKLAIGARARLLASMGELKCVHDQNLRVLRDRRGALTVG